MTVYGLRSKRQGSGESGGIRLPPGFSHGDSAEDGGDDGGFFGGGFFGTGVGPSVTGLLGAPLHFVTQGLVLNAGAAGQRIDRAFGRPESELTGGGRANLDFQNPFNFNPQTQIGAGEVAQQLFGDSGNETLFRTRGLGRIGGNFDVSLNRVLGFTGDIALDPLSYVGAGATRAAGGGEIVARRENYLDHAARLLEAGDTEAAAIARADLSVGRISTERLRAANVDRRLNIGVGRRGVSIPGTAGAVQSGQRVTGSVKRFFRQNQFAERIFDNGLLANRANQRVYDAAREVVDGRIPHHEFAEFQRGVQLSTDVTAITSRATASLRSSLDEALSEVGDSKAVRRAYRTYGDELVDLLESPGRIQQLVKGLPDGDPIIFRTADGTNIPIRPLLKFFSDSADDLSASAISPKVLGVRGRKLGLGGEYADWNFGYVSRHISPEALEGINTETIGRFAKAIRERELNPGVKIGNTILQDEGLLAGLAPTGTVSRRQLREVASGTLDEGVVWERDLGKQLDLHVLNAGRTIGSAEVGQRMIDEGLADGISDFGPFSLSPRKSYEIIVEAIGRTRAFAKGDKEAMQAILEFDTHNMLDILNDPDSFESYLGRARKFASKNKKRGGGKRAVKLYDEALDNMELARLTPDNSEAGYFLVKAQEASLRAMLERQGTKAMSLNEYVDSFIALTKDNPKRLRKLMHSGEVFTNELAGMLGVTPGNTEELFGLVRVNEVIAEAMNGRVALGQVPSNAFTDMWRKYESFFKRTATATPAFNVRNMFGGLVQEMAAGHTPADTKFWADAYTGYIRNGNFNHIPFEDRRAFAEIIERADIFTFERTRFGDETDRFFKEGSISGPLSRSFDSFGANVVNAPLTGTVNRGLAVETMLRGSHIMAKMRRGFTYDSARDSMFRYHFDYADLSKADQYAKMAMPFWTFASRNLPLQIELATRRPGLFNDIARYQAQTEEKFAPAEIPDYYKEQVTIYGPGGRLALQPDIPFNDLIRRVNDFGNVKSASDAANIFLNDSSPLLKVAWVATTSRDPFFDSFVSGDRPLPIPDLTGESEPAAPLFSLAAKLMNPIINRNDAGEMRIDAKFLYALQQLFPAYRQAVRISPDATDRAPLQAEWLRYIFGGFRISGESPKTAGGIELTPEERRIMDELVRSGG